MTIGQRSFSKNNKKEQDRLNGFPLTSGEMQDNRTNYGARTPMRLNGFINGKTVPLSVITRTTSFILVRKLFYIYNRLDIAGGSTYQIAQQPYFSTKSKMLNQRRGDLTLLINGMPLIHLELKRSGIPISQACNQIEKYAHEGVFEFYLVQVFVAMNPDESIYFANPGADGDFSSYCFSWGDFNNEPVNY